ncbi:MAG: response regulator [Lachnospiraceae bacterium]|nr:response regulator [Lachnospiraceae bacterium]
MPFLQYILTIREEIACLFVLIYIAWSYFSVRHKNTYAHTLFSSLILISIVNLAMDTLTMYTVNNLDLIPPWLNHLLHVVYVGSFPIILYILYSYVKCLTFHIERHRITALEMIPLVLAIVGIAVLPMHYVVTPYSNYSSGPADNVAYLCAFIYFFVSVWMIVRYRAQVEKKALSGIATALASLATVVVLQGIFEQLLITGIAVTLINVALFYTVESPDAVLIEKLALAREKAEAANKAKSSFLARMSHEIRTPLNTMLGMDEMILREAEQEAILTYASNIRDSGARLLSIINEILDYSKVEAGKLEISPVQYEVTGMLHDLMTMLREQTEEKDLNFITDFDTEIPQVLNGDEIRIKQCVGHLLSNAVKFTDSGTVTLKVSFDLLSENMISLYFEIKDTGIGLKQEDMERLSSPSADSWEINYNVFEGTGLGLTITRQLLGLMGSELNMESEYGVGSVFSFQLRQEVISWEPIGETVVMQKPGREERDAYKALFHAPEARILVIDDTEMNLVVITQFLKETEIRIDTALSGQEALMRATEEHYDICLVDHMMPEMDGVETMRELKKLSGTMDSVYIALTANAVSGAREFYLRAGFDDYIAKPVQGDKLERLLLRYLPQTMVMMSSSRKKKEEELSEKQKDTFLQIDGLNTDDGITYCGSKAAYLEVLQMFYESLSERASEIEHYYHAEDIENYRVKVHALKSSAKIIGASVLSEAARELEDAAVEGNLDLIREKTDDLLELYRSFEEGLSVLFMPEQKEEEEKPPADEETLRIAYQAMEEYAKDFEYDMFEAALNSLNGYALSDFDEEKTGELRKMLYVLDWDGILKKLEKDG